VQLYSSDKDPEQNGELILPHQVWGIQSPGEMAINLEEGVANRPADVGMGRYIFGFSTLWWAALSALVSTFVSVPGALRQAGMVRAFGPWGVCESSVPGLEGKPERPRCRPYEVDVDRGLRPSGESKSLAPPRWASSSAEGASHTRLGQRPSDHRGEIRL